MKKMQQLPSNLLLTLLLCLPIGGVYADSAPVTLSAGNGTASSSSSHTDNKTFTEAELDQMMAPVALYPDSLLSQILMASTYPANISEAVKWAAENPKQEGDAAVKAVQDKPWDPSVMSLVAFPQVLEMMGKKPEWIQ